MKKTMVLFLACILTTGLFSQNEKYIATMEKNVTQLKEAQSMEAFQKLANVFERISNAEKNEWLPAYYSAYCNVFLSSKAAQSGKMDQVDAFLKKAQTAIDHCLTIKPKESEVYALQGYIYIGHISANPMVAGPQYTPKAHEAFAKAIAMDANNPRAYYLRGQLIYYTPEFFGGGPEKAFGDLVKAGELFEIFEKASSIHPDWGKGSNRYHLQEAEKVVNGK